MKVFPSLLIVIIHMRLNMNTESFKISNNQFGCKSHYLD
ncbi:hypothetical protein KM1_073540, partial [Entamoeba histolytica HM-3:IMSS]